MVSSYFAPAWAVAWRYLHNLYTKPAVLIPGLIFPLFFLAAGGMIFLSLRWPVGASG